MKPQISVKKCLGAAHCKPSAEIDIFAAMTRFQFFYRTKVYNPNEYFSKTFTFKTTQEWFPLIPGTQSSTNLLI